MLAEYCLNIIQVLFSKPRHTEKLVAAFDPYTNRGIGNSLSNRTGLLSELTKKLAEQEVRDDALRTRLLHKVPKSLHQWLDDDAILTNLFAYGKADTKVYYGDFGFKNAADIRRKMVALRRARHDVVTIAVSTGGGANSAQIIVTAVL